MNWWMPQWMNNKISSHKGLMEHLLGSPFGYSPNCRKAVGWWRKWNTGKMKYWAPLKMLPSSGLAARSCGRGKPFLFLFFSVRLPHPTHTSSSYPPVFFVLCCSFSFFTPLFTPTQTPAEFFLILFSFFQSSKLILFILLLRTRWR